MPLPLPHRMGSEPIYLQHHCRSHSSVNKSISYNGIQLLRQHFLAVAATVAAPCEWTFRQCPGAPSEDFSVNGCFTVVDPGGPRGHGHLGPVKISHKKDGHRRWLHRFHVSWPPQYPAAGSTTGFRQFPSSYYPSEVRKFWFSIFQTRWQ